jgi:hypothetical protein
MMTESAPVTPPEGMDTQDATGIRLEQLFFPEIKPSEHLEVARFHKPHRT